MIAVTEWYSYDNMSDAVTVTAKHRSNNNIYTNKSQNVIFFNTLTMRKILI